MKLLISICLFLLATPYCQSQIEANAAYIKLSGGSVLFGTGDIPGFGIYVEGSGNVFKKNKYLSKHLQTGMELYFESGVKNPTVINPTPDEFSHDPFFNHISQIGIDFKSTFYPFRKFLKGINIGIGAGCIFSFNSYEGRAVREVYTSTLSRRMSELRFENRFLLGYRISVGYDVFIMKGQLLVGVRTDLANLNNGDYNQLIGAKIGYRF